MQWHYVALFDDLEEDDVVRVNVENTPIALYRLADGCFATHDICTHAYACLSDGFVENDTVECPLHQGIFHIPTGRPVSGPVTEPLATYPVRLEGGKVYVGIG